jgi:fructokinase
MKELDVTALGEILIDFTESGVSDSGGALYERNAGGAPANVAAAVARLGGKAAFVGKVGPDSFGTFLKDTLLSLGVDASGMRVSSGAHTTLAFVSIGLRGERSFSFCRSPGADTELRADELDSRPVESTRVLHVGSLSLTREPSRGATFAAIDRARASGALVSYDPNWRPALWDDREAARETMRRVVPLADIVKVSEEELELLYGIAPNAEDDLERGARAILESGPRLALVTLGDQGTFWSTASSAGLVSAFASDAVDTTGAGDAFVGALLWRLTRLDPSVDPFARDAASIAADVRFANAAAAVCVRRRGAIPALPSFHEAMRVYGNG